MFTIIVTLLLIIVLVIWIWRSDREKGKDTSIQALFSILSVFLGVFLALSVNSHHEHQQTMKNLVQVISVAKSEAIRNLEILQEVNLNDDNKRLVLESPATALDVLLDMPTFLEQGSTEIISELLQLNTQLNWTITYRPAELSAMYQAAKIVSANKENVINNTKRVIELLQEQLNLLKQ